MHANVSAPMHLKTKNKVITLKPFNVASNRSFKL